MRNFSVRSRNEGKVSSGDEVKRLDVEPVVSELADPFSNDDQPDGLDDEIGYSKSHKRNSFDDLLSTRKKIRL